VRKGGILQNFDIHSVQTQLIQDTSIVPQAGFNTLIKEDETSGRKEISESIVKTLSAQLVKEENA
jgi:hypothetical protein